MYIVVIIKNLQVTQIQQCWFYKNFFKILVFISLTLFLDVKGVKELVLDFYLVNICAKGYFNTLMLGLITKMFSACPCTIADGPLQVELLKLKLIFILPFCCSLFSKGSLLLLFSFFPLQGEILTHSYLGQLQISINVGGKVC